ncbi:hypothetical protein ACFWPX_29940 [Nocardia sp. NPDC058518]|uniref:hypothetical protein n=1 Tax=Nocardia sp. NPDC058518 TaxID=3346534 RepID=UPI003663867B
MNLKPIAVLVISASICFTAVACSGSEDTGGAAPSARPPGWPAPITSAGPAAGDDPDAVAGAGVREINTLRPAQEAADDPIRRARPWLSEAFTARLGPAAPAAKGSLEWADWANDRAQIDAQVLVSGERPPHEAEGHADRKVGVTQTVTWPDGRQQTLPTFTVTVALTATSSGWRIDGLRRW